ncbi:unnamed protein product [Brachionus calyciflorus]|uniref:Uncharacterized protein n=1 Tax=Brachionus calyciflorus TaxID=104777 RepID=A0A814DAH0_9BILA|nr:unnamed protein product [Brachionus calyciflorus]
MDYLIGFKARCMLIASNSHLNLWSAALDTANYLRNRTFKLEESTNDDDFMDKAENEENVSNNDQNGSDLNRVKTFESNKKDKNSCENPIENQAQRRSNRCSKPSDRYNPEAYFTQDINIF